MTKDALWIIASEDIFTAPSAAEYLGITRSAIWHAVKNGKLRCTARDKLFTRIELDEYRETTKLGRPFGSTKKRGD